MANYNKVILVGNLTRDPQLTYLPSQMPVVDFGLAINHKWTSANGEKKEEVCFVDCRAFGKQAETINHYLSKGRQVLVEGRLTFQQWNAQDGSKRSKLSVTVESFQFLGQGPGAGEQPDANAAAVRTPMRSRGGHEAPPPDQHAPDEEIPQTTGKEEDIPF